MWCCLYEDTMKALKVVGIIAVALWMAFTSWRLEYAIKASEMACDEIDILGEHLYQDVFKGLPYCPGVISERPR